MLDTSETCKTLATCGNMVEVVDEFIPTIRRRDMAGKSCLLCDEGELTETPQPDCVQCNHCNALFLRYMTKREMAELLINLEN